MDEDSTRLEELLHLASSLGFAAEGMMVRCGRLHPGFFFGRGGVAEIKAALAQKEIARVVVNAALSSVQHRNLERVWQCRVLDRTALILEIFAARARSREGRLQVELAALDYQRGRLTRSWTHLERQRGGRGFTGGPGERQLESDRRLLDARIMTLRAALENVRRTRRLQRRARRRAMRPVAVLVGYTNAGKSTLFNRLTGAGVVAEGRLFSTLDPTMRAVLLPGGGTLMLSDTVGFIRDLPPQLVAAFGATLEELREADILIHVRDISSPDYEAQGLQVRRVLEELGLARLLNDPARYVEVLNKSDRLAARATPSPPPQGRLLLSAASGRGVRALLGALAAIARREHHAREVSLRHGEGAALSWLYRHGRIAWRRDDADGVHVRAAVSAAAWQRFRRLFPHTATSSHKAPPPS